MSHADADDEERHRLTAVQGLAALSLDALSSVAYGPEAILVVLVAAGVAGLRYSLPVTGAIIVLVVSYRQVIEAFPDGGGAYAVSKAHLGTQASLVAAGSLIVDYVLNAAVGVSAGIAALTAAFPSLYGATVWLCLAALALITGLNLWGVSESAKVFTVPTLAFVVAILAVIIGGLVRSHPAVPLDRHLGASTEAVGVLLVLKAFASGCSALTGVEAIANAVPEFRQPRARRAQHTEVWLGVLLGVMLIGLGAEIHRFAVMPHSGTTVLAQLTEASLGHNVFYYAVQLITLVLLALAANTSFGGLPVLAALLAKDNFLPHMFGLLFSRVHHIYGRIGALLELGQTPKPPARKKSLVVVPVSSISRLTAAGISTALSLAEDVVAVNVEFTDPEGMQAGSSFRDQWEQWHPNVPLVTLVTSHRSIAPPIVKYLHEIETQDKYHQLVVLIPAVQPKRFWYAVLFNQRGVILDRAIRHGTVNVVLCRLRYRLDHFADYGAPRVAPPSAAGSPPPG